VQFIETPGHSHDMMCAYIPSSKYLFSSDNLFEGGRIAKLSTPDFSLDALRASIKKLANMPISGLFPGHLSPMAEDGAQPVKIANELFAQGKIPESIV
jgi:glyoxylase-like metal-dependent hydrolase (beta-lactamase superfamily II)